MRRFGDVAASSVGNLAVLATAAALPCVLPEMIKGAQTADEIETAVMKSLPPEVRGALRARSDFQTFEFIGFEQTAPINPLAAREVLGWLDVVGARAPQAEVAKEVSRCLSVTAAKAKDQADLQVTIAVMTDELREFPAVVVKECLREWARTVKWMPTLAEIRERCLASTQKQRALRSVLEKAIMRGDAA